MNIVVYAKDTGQILRSVACPEDMLSMQYDPETEDYIEHDQVDDSLFYVLDGAMATRPVLEEVIAGTTISNLPNPTMVGVNGALHEVTDGEADLTFSHAGTYPVRLASFPYIDKTVEVTQP